MTSRDEKRLAAELAAWLEGQAAAPTQDPTARAVARTAVLLVDALAPTPLHPVTRARLYERALAGSARDAEGLLPGAPGDPWREFWRAARRLPTPAWVGLGGVLLGLLAGAIWLRQRGETEEPG